MAYNADALDASLTPEEKVFQEETVDQDEQKLLFEAMRKERAVTKRRCKTLLKSISSYLQENGTIRDNLPPEALSAIKRVGQEIAAFMQEINGDFMEFVGVYEAADNALSGHQMWMSDWENVLSKIKVRTPIEPPPDPQTPTVPNSTFLEGALLNSNKLKPTITLPELTLEPFDGQLGTYEPFKETFNSLMGELDASQLFKAKYLKDCLLKKEALDRVKHVSIHQPNAIEKIWECLDQRYARTQVGQHIYSAKLYQINQFKRCKNDTELKMLYDYVYDMSNKLREISNNPESGEDAKVILHTLLTPRLQHKATKLRDDTPNEYTLNKLLNLMKEQLDHNESNALLSGTLQINAGLTEGKGSKINSSIIKNNTPSSEPCKCNTRDQNVLEKSGDRIEIQSYFETPQRCTPTQSQVYMNTYQSDPGAGSGASNIASADSRPRPPNPQPSNTQVHNNSNLRNFQENYTRQPYRNFNAPGSYRQPYQRPPNSSSNRVYNPQNNRPPNPRNIGPNNSNFNRWRTEVPSNNNQNRNVQNTISKDCCFCGSQTHNSHYCDSIRSPGIFLGLCRERELCRNCLVPKHIAAYCPENSMCDKGCNSTMKHCRLICDIVNAPKPGVYSISNRLTGSMINSVRMQTAQCLISNSHSGKNIIVRAFFDTGSTHSYIRINLAKSLELPVLEKRELLQQSFGGTTKSVFSHVVEAKLGYHSHSNGSTYYKNVSLITAPHLCGELDSYDLSQEQKYYIEQNNYRLADIEAQYKGTLKIDLLIGLDYYYDFVHSQHVKLPGSLYLISSDFGYMFAGPSNLAENKQNVALRNSVRCNFLKTTSMFQNTILNDDLGSSFEEEITENIKTFSDLESIGILPPTEEESPILTKFNSELNFNGERYFVPLLWKFSKKHLLLSNFKMAFQRLKYLFKKIQKSGDETLKSKYEQIIEEQIESKTITLVDKIGTSSEVEERISFDSNFYDKHLVYNSNSTPVYLPHRGTLKASTGKLRIVYDGSSRPYKGALSINDCLEKGPCLINSLVTVLVRFRLGTVAYTGDITKAFHQVGICEEDQDSLRFLWKQNDIISIYKFQRLPFGLTCSPFILGAVIKYHIENHPLYQDLKQALDAFYVDDFINSDNNEEKALKTKTQLVECLSSAGMSLCKWNSNSKYLKTKFLENEMDTLPTQESILGTVWDTERDTININSERILSKLKYDNTKRELYSIISQVYDPMGLVSPGVLLAKVILHEACRLKLDWKHKIPDHLIEKWNTWKEDLKYLSQIKLDRCITLPNASYELHGFCDASTEAFAAVVYLISRTEQLTISNVVISKTRVAPFQPMSIPRLELCAAVLLVNLMTSTHEILKNINITSKHYYTDAMDVLHWIMSDSYSWPVFVSNRIKQILLNSDIKDWSYVNTKFNPADIPSRGLSFKHLVDNQFWFNGPEFLVTKIKPWDEPVKIPPISEIKYEEKDSILVMSNIPKYQGISSLIGVNYTNQYHVLMKVTQMVIKAKQLFLSKLSSNNEINKVELSMKNIQLIWIQSIQFTYYPEEINVCQLMAKGNNVSSKQPDLINNLSLYWDDKYQVLRCKTRLRESYFARDCVDPILLPEHCKFTYMLIMSIHIRLCHVGVKQTLSTLRNEFWVPKGRRMVTTVINACMTCRKVSASTFQLPPPPPLPEYRANINRPFDTIGLDFAGPMSLKDQNKIHIALFTCTSTRALHLEILPNLSVHSFLLALRRFASRRGFPSLIVSDNAKTFKCVSKKLKKLFDDPKLKKYLDGRRMEWQFYVERAPWHGGFIERLVALVKNVLRRTVGSALLTYEEFNTAVYEAEMVINDRPLTYVYYKPDEGEPLTPNMLITGYNLTDLPPLVKGEEKAVTNLVIRLKYLERVKSSFWKLWQKEYLSELTVRHMSRKAKDNLPRAPQVGELVLLKNESLPRHRWSIGKVTVADRSTRDGKVRSVSVKIPKTKDQPGGEYRRSPCFLIPLEAELSYL